VRADPTIPDEVAHRVILEKAEPEKKKPKK